MTCRQRVKFPRNLFQLTHRRVLAPVPIWDRSSPSPPACLPLYAVNLQRRCLVSFPHYVEQRTTASHGQSTNSNLSVCVTNASNDPSFRNQAIVLAAEEANRLLVQSAKHHLYYKSKAVPPTNKDAWLCDQDDSIRKEVVDAANKLLLVSSSLQEKIGAENLLLEEQQRHFMKYISVLHRAFLALTAKCLDAIRIIQASVTSTSTEHVEALLDLSLALAQRAHSLGLPFHLPLYQQLMEVTASTLKTTTTNPIASVLLKLASYASTLNTTVPLNDALFRPSLLALIANKQFNDVVDLLYGMRDHHGLATLDRPTVTEIYVSLHAVVKSSFCVRLESRRDLPESPITEAVAILEPSVLMLIEEWTNEAKVKQDKLRHLLESLDEYKMESLLSSLNDTTGNVDDDEIELVENEDESDDETDEYIYDDNDVVMISAKTIDPLDQAVNAILTKRVKSEKVKAIMADMVHAGSSSGSGRSPPSDLPKFITVTANLTPDEKENVDYWAGECSDLSSDEDSYSDDDQQVVPWMKSTRSQFPDISTQIVELNNGRDFRFTRNYEDQIWMNEGEEHFHDGMETPYSSRLEESDDENDDDDDDDSDSDGDSDDYR